MKKLAIVTTHPVQYNAPWFKLLAESSEIDPKVFYTWGQAGTGGRFDPGFGRSIEWDIPLLEGYEFVFVENTSRNPGTHHFRGMINPSLNQQIAEWGPDAVLIFGWSFYSHLNCLRHFHGRLPVLFRGDSTLLDEIPGIKKKLRKLFLRWVYRNVDFALYAGTNNRAYFLNCGLRADQLVLMPHAIDNDRFSIPDEIYKQAALAERAALGIDEEDMVLLFAGKLENKKNPFFVLELAARITDSRFKIIIVGNGDLEKDLKKSAAADKRIIFLDFQNQRRMPVIYRMADFFILPSSGPGETWGLAVNEAMASGCAVLVSEKAGGAIDLVRENENGLIIRSVGNDACFELLRQALRDRSVVAKMKKSSLRVITGFSMTRNRTILEGLLGRITVSRKKGN